jgi:hypothetical protein
MRVGLVAVVLSTLIPLAVGLLVTGLVARRAPRGVPAVRGLGVLLAVASTASPLVADADGTTRAVLAAMHLVVGAAYWTATRSSRSTPADDRADVAPSSSPVAP